jgi:hypothetical protein
MLPLDHTRNTVVAKNRQPAMSAIANLVPASRQTAFHSIFGIPRAITIGSKRPFSHALAGIAQVDLSGFPKQKRFR